MAEEGKGRNVEWSWVAMLAVSIVILLIGQAWNGAKEQAAEDHARLEAQNGEIASVKVQIEKLQISVESLTKASDARWSALLLSLPEVERRMRRPDRGNPTPVFEPEWQRK